MESVNFETSGEDIEQALMDLGPLLGVSIKEEVPEEPPDTAASGAAPSGNVGSISEPTDTSKPEGDGTEGADSLASPQAGRGASTARCVICRQTLAQIEGTPKLMECLHSACEPCIKAKVEEKLASGSGRDFLGAERVTITCPACRLQCQASNMIDQRFVLEKVAQDQAGTTAGGPTSDQQCNSCDESAPATSYCVDCAEFICDNCVQAHQRLKITKDHTIKSKEEAIAEMHAAQINSRSAHDMFCREHPQERLSLFCETCDRLTCRDCQLQHHRDHKYQFSTEMAAQARANISSLLSEVSYKRVLLGSAMKVIKDRQQLIADKKKSLVHDITQTVVKLTNAINTRGKQLVLRLNEVCDAKQRTLSEKKDALEQLAAITDHCVEFVNAALEQGSDTAVLYSKRAVCAHLQRIKSRRADIPNPEIPVRISLALDKLPELIRVLSTIGAIVVDGKVDGGGGCPTPPGAPGAPAQGPYHPPAQPPPNSAVVALQQVAMHQSYVQSVSGGSGAGNPYLSPLQQAMRPRPHTPLRHPHVTSTTHPHHLQGMSEMNLRGLLNTSAQRALPPAASRQQQQAMHHAYQQMIGAYNANAYPANNAMTNAIANNAMTNAIANNAMTNVIANNNSNASGRRSLGPRTSPAPHYAKWHIPQQQHQHQVGFELAAMGSSGSPSGIMPSGSDFKITLGRQHSTPRAQPSIVTSTNPKTPSPSLNGGISSELDKVCAESVQDLMATIAKLDSNGVQVVAEVEPPSPASHVHSSTDTTARIQPPASTSPTQPGNVTSSLHHVEAANGTSSPKETAPIRRKSALRAWPARCHFNQAYLSLMQQDKPPQNAGKSVIASASGGASDPNEDWCAVCMDGGELMCCDKCPKVFHQYCHIPTIEKLPDETETWQCLLCVNFAELPPEDPTYDGEGLSPRQQKIVERVTLELYCQYELSLAFREPVPAENTHYHANISRPMCLDMIRMKLQPLSGSRYTHCAQFVRDCRLMFRNAYAYNAPDSQIYKDAKRLEEFFDAQLVKWLPEYAYWSGEGEPPVKRARMD